MKILLVHNFHREGSASGDDMVVRREASLLKEHGHNVKIFSKENSEIYNADLFKKAKITFEIPWSKESYKALKEEINKFEPDVVHVHTFFPLLSPSVYKAILDAGKPVVQSLHDFYFFCLNAFFFRNGDICEECVEKGLFNGVRKRCVGGSFIKSLVSYLSINKFRKSGILNKISAFIVFTEFGRRKFIELGLPEEKIFVKPHFLPNKKLNEVKDKQDYFLFIGRIGEEKGIKVLIDAWENLNLPLKIGGSGPLEQWLNKQIQRRNNIEFVGFIPPDSVHSLIKKSYAVVIPSICYETFCLSVIESYYNGIPVIASKIGSLEYLIKDGYTGLLFKKGDPKDLANKVIWLWAHPEEREKIAKNARREFEEKYTAGKNYQILINIYQRAIELHKVTQ